MPPNRDQREVSAVGLQFTRFRVVAQICLKQHIAQITFGLGIGDRCDDLDAMFEISRHPVGTTDVNLIVAAIREPEHTAVLEKTTDDASHS